MVRVRVRVRVRVTIRVRVRSHVRSLACILHALKGQDTLGVLHVSCMRLRVRTCSESCMYLACA